MNKDDVIGWVARAEAMRVRPERVTTEVVDKEEKETNAEDIKNKVVPWISLKYNEHAIGREMWTVRGHDFMGHDNEQRMQLMIDWLKIRVLPIVDPAARSSLQGRWNIELHDSYAYLPNASTYDNVLTFSRPADARERVAMIPDPYQITGYGGIVTAGSHDQIPWSKKQSKLFFAGTTTGSREPNDNVRIKACVWSLDHRDVTDFSITNVAQMSIMHAVQQVPALRRVLQPHVDVHEHHKYRYQVNIVGNTACWSRVPMVMASKSVLVHLYHRDAMWYYPMLRADQHYVEARGFDDFLTLRKELEDHPAKAQHIVSEANQFVRDYLGPRKADTYMAKLLEESAFFGAP